MHATKTSNVSNKSSIVPLRWEATPGSAGDLRLQTESV